jgi:uncharacterized protein YjcR
MTTRRKHYAIPRKFDASQVLAIRALYADGMRKNDLSAKFGVNQSTIRRIVELSTYKEVKEPLEKSAQHARAL